jgi:hypothetical protein
MKGVHFLVVSFFSFNAVIAFSEEVPGRTDIFYDSARNMMTATASTNPDYNTQFYYRTRMLVSFRQACVTRAIGHWYSPPINEEKTNGRYDPGAR